MRARLDVAGRGAEPVEHHVDLAADEILQGRPGTLVGHVLDLGPGDALEQLAGEVVRGAVAGRPVGQRARARLRGLDQLAQRLRLDPVRVDHDHLRHDRDDGDRLEVLLDVVGELRVDPRRDRMVHRAEEERVAVLLRPRGGPGAERTAGPAAVVDDERLPELLRRAPPPADARRCRSRRPGGTARSWSPAARARPARGPAPSRARAPRPEHAVAPPSARSERRVVRIGNASLGDLARA